MDIDIAGGLLCRQGRLLLGKRSARRGAYPGVWDMPGGHMEVDETAEQALVRELREELGVTATAWRELAVLRAPAMGAEDGAEDAHVLRLHVFLVNDWCGEPRNLAPDEHEALAWFTLEATTRLTLAHAAYPRLFAQALELVR
ncbi:MAG TPA: NUDIX domain-containing protein [Ktedonobacterales bacterium]|nr:NUDIX domain-containing protein [Ktedonobacterales bacterium]